MKPIYSPATVQFMAMKEQPSSGIRKSPFVKSGLEDGHGREIKPPFLPGEKCYLREGWRHIANTVHDGMPVQAVVQYSDMTTKYCGSWPDFASAPKEAWWNTGKQPWRSPVTMPLKFARRFFTIISCEPMQIGEVTIADAEATGVVAAWDGLSANQQEGLKEKYHRDAIGEDDLFYLLWQSKHPGTWPDCWCWRVEGEEVRK